MQLQYVAILNPSVELQSFRLRRLRQIHEELMAEEPVKPVYAQNCEVNCGFSPHLFPPIHG